MNQESRVGERNPLRQMYPGRIRSFDEWQARFQQSENFEEMMGLLHGLYDAKNEYSLCKEAVLFLLEIADGYDSHNFSNLEEARRHLVDSDMENRRKTLAQKAFQILCLGFFKEGKEYGYSPRWKEVLYSEALFEKVLWFLRPTPRYGGGRNCRFEEKPEHPYEIFMKFVQEFVKFGWDFNGQSRRYADDWDGETREASRQRFLAARLQFIDIMNEMKMLQWLGTQELDEICLQKLTSMAIKREYRFPDCEYNKERLPKDLQEAVWAGSFPAHVLLVYRAKQAQQVIYNHEAQVREREAKKKAREKELEDLRKQREALDRKAKKLLGS